MRSGYTEECSGIELINWRGAVKSALRGKRGQTFLREMRDALDAMPEKRLIKNDLVNSEGCCAMGAVAIARGQDVSTLDPEWSPGVADAFNIAPAMAQEIAFENDERHEYIYSKDNEGNWTRRPVTPEERWQHMRAWVEAQIAHPGSSKP